MPNLNSRKVSRAHLQLLNTASDALHKIDLAGTTDEKLHVKTIVILLEQHSRRIFTFERVATNVSKNTEENKFQNLFKVNRKWCILPKIKLWFEIKLLNKLWNIKQQLLRQIHSSWNIETFWLSLQEKCPYSEIFCSVISRIWTKYGEILRISPYSVQIRENNGAEKLRIRTLSTQCVKLQRSVKYWDFTKFSGGYIFWKCTASAKFRALMQCSTCYVLQSPYIFSGCRIRKQRSISSKCQS